MKICITSQGENINSEIDPRFGRCQYFLIIDTESQDVESMHNDSQMATGGAGIQAAQNVAKTEVSFVLTGNIGPNAYDTLKAANIKVITGLNGTIKEILERFNRGELKENDAPSVDSHSGLK